MNYRVSILQLSSAFMRDYPESQYPELMTKQGRPYTCLLIDTHDNYLICIPFRSSIGHNNAYLFTNTVRSRRTRSGLDYSKVVLIQKAEYIDAAQAVVDQDEYTEMQTHVHEIVEEIVAYIEAYIMHVNGEHPIHRREFERKYKYSTLPYFHDILGIQNN